MPDVLYSLTPREFDNMVHGARQQEERQMQQAWNQTRMIMWAALAPHQKKNSNLTPKKVMQFDWDETEADGEALGAATPEEEQAKIAEGIEMYKRIDAAREKQKQQQTQ